MMQLKLKWQYKLLDKSDIIGYNRIYNLIKKG